MADTTKISFKFGVLEFSGEGSEIWLEKQLDKLLKQPINFLSAPLSKESSGFSPQTKSTSSTLVAFLTEKDAKSNQNKKFLATATYLQIKGKKPLKVGDIAKALKDSNQGRLGNPSDTLSQNISKGFCERDGEGFFVTEEGYRELGVS